VHSYFARLPDDRREALLSVRDVVRRVFPHAHETMQYRMPTFEVSGSARVAIASQKNHLALYVLDEDAVRRHRPRLGNVDVGKCCIRFRRLEDLRMDAVEALLHDAVRHH
jgi:uncharacterized protein YdhG (YjbR/CyaY superfamily)